jgi:hypothetical protein
MTRNRIVLCVVAIVLAAGGGGEARAQLQGNVQEVWDGRSPDPSTGDTHFQSAAAAGLGTSPSGQKVYVAGTWQSATSKWAVKLQRYPVDPVTGETNHAPDVETIWPTSYVASCDVKAMVIAPSPVDDSLSNIYVAAEIPGRGGHKDLIVLAYDSKLDLAWTTRFNAGLGGDEQPVAIDANGTIVTVVSQSWGGDPASGGTGWDIQTLILHTTDGGIFIDPATTRFGGAGTDWPAAVLIRNGGPYVAGTTTGSDGRLKYLTAAYFGSEQTPQLVFATTHGVTGNDNVVTDMAAVGGFYVTGYTQNPPPLATDASYFTLKFDPYTGAEPWTAATYGGILYQGPDGGDSRAVKVRTTDRVTEPKDNVYVTGTSWSATTGNDIVTLRYQDQVTAPLLIWEARLNSGLDGYPAIDLSNDDAATAMSVWEESGDLVYVSGYRLNAYGTKDYVTAKYTWDFANPKIPTWLVFYPSGVSSSSLDSAPTANTFMGVLPDGYRNILVTGGSTFGTSAGDFLTIRYRDLDP